MPCLAFIACQKSDGMLPISNVVGYGATSLFEIGDYFYNDSAGTVTLNGVTISATVYGSGNNTQAQILSKYVNVYGVSGLASYQDLIAARNAGKIRRYAMPDDHDGCWNNNDHSLVAFKGAYNVADGSSTTDALTQADVISQWRLGQTALAIIQAAYFDNVWGPANGNIPSAMIGTAVAADYPTKYFFVDYDENLQPNGGPAVLRVIVPDCISYKDPAANTDNAQKQFLGSVQDRWLRDKIIEGQRFAAGVTIAWTKDIFNRDNGDGGVGYRTYIDSLMAWIDTNNYAVDHITGDRHNPHVGISRKSRGFAYDAFTMCACPSGQGTGGLTQYPELDWSYSQNDACVIGTLTLNTKLRTKTLAIRDAFTMEALYTAVIPFGSRLPIRTSAPKWWNFVPNPAPFRTAPTAPLTGVAYSNATNVMQAVILYGTMTSVAISRDNGTTVDTIPTTVGGQYLLMPGDTLTPVYSALTRFAVYPMQATP